MSQEKETTDIDPTIGSMGPEECQRRFAELKDEILTQNGKKCVRAVRAHSNEGPLAPTELSDATNISKENLPQYIRQARSLGIITRRVKSWRPGDHYISEFDPIARRFNIIGDFNLISPDKLVDSNGDRAESIEAVRGLDKSEAESLYAMRTVLALHASEKIPAQPSTAPNLVGDQDEEKTTIPWYDISGIILGLATKTQLYYHGSLTGSETPEYSIHNTRKEYGVSANGELHFDDLRERGQDERIWTSSEDVDPEDALDHEGHRLMIDHVFESIHEENDIYEAMTGGDREYLLDGDEDPREPSADYNWEEIAKIAMRQKLANRFTSTTDPDCEKDRLEWSFKLKNTNWEVTIHVDS